MPLQRTEGPVYKPHAKRDPSEIRIHSALQQNVQLSVQTPAPPKRLVLETAIDPKDKKKDTKKDAKKDANKPKHPDGRPKKNKPGAEGACDAFLSTFDCLKWFRATAKSLVFTAEFHF